MKPALPALLTSFGILLATVAHALWPHYAGPLVTCLIGALGIAAALLVSKPTDAAWIQALEQGLEKTAPAQLAELRSARKTKLPPPMLHVLMLLTVMCLATGCISSAPIVPVTPANQAQISSCQTTASWHNGIVLNGFMLGAGSVALSGVAALESDPSTKTGLAIATAIVGALTMTATALAGFTSSNFANSHCSDVVGSLPVLATKKVAP